MPPAEVISRKSSVGDPGSRSGRYRALLVKISCAFAFLGVASGVFIDEAEVDVAIVSRGNPEDGV